MSLHHSISDKTISKTNKQKKTKNKKKSLPVLQHPPYSTDLSSCDIFKHLNLKLSEKGSHFESLKKFYSDVASALKRLSECFQEWQTVWKVYSIQSEGEHTVATLIKG
jgi:hypothetical protein